jgi:hypothetical protein
LIENHARSASQAQRIASPRFTKHHPPRDDNQREKQHKKEATDSDCPHDPTSCARHKSGFRRACGGTYLTLALMMNLNLSVCGLPERQERKRKIQS